MENLIPKKIDYIFRPDSLVGSGGGHISRCLSLAECLHEEDEKFFILEDKCNIFKERLNKRKIKKIRFEDIVNKKILFKVCVLDGYNIKIKEIDFWKSVSDFLVVIDDFDKLHDYADLIINIGLPDKVNSIKKNKILSNMKYAIVNREFSGISNGFNVKEKITNILLNFGYIDSKGITLKTLDELEKIHKFLGDLNIKVCIGSDSPQISKIKEKLNISSYKTCLYINHQNMVDLIKNSDLIIGSGGVGLLERISVGVPSITISTAQNQSNQLIKLSKKNTTIYKSLESFGSDELLKCILSISRDYNKRLIMSNKCKSTVDGNGSFRVSKVIKNLFN